MKNFFVAIIPARSGSKTIKNKNMSLVNNKPMIYWSIIEALKSKYIKEILISTNCPKVKNYCKKFLKNNKINLISRPNNISKDNTKMLPVINHAKNYSKYNDDKSLYGFILLQPTSPLRKKKDIDDLIDCFYKHKWDSGFTAGVLKDFLIWRKNKLGGLSSINYDFKNRGQRFFREDCFVENSLAYIFKPKILLKHNNRLGGKIGMTLNYVWQSFEIDEKDDWEFVSSIFKQKIIKKKEV